MSQLDALLPHCAFPDPGTPVACAFSGGPDSTALVALALRHGCDVTAHHVDHALRPESALEAESARAIADRLGVDFVLHRRPVGAGPNLEARARHARLTALPADAMTGHTADDQAETVLLRLLRGAGGAGLAAMEPGPTHPILALRRDDTETVCRVLDLTPVRDRSNDLPGAWRNRVRAELLPLAADIAERDVVAIIARTASLLRDDEVFLDELAAEIDPCDARAVAAAHPVLARRALRRWLTEDGYPPDVAAIDRVIAIAHGRGTACELPGGRRVERSRQHLRIVAPER